jgi:DNA methyltransferase 1-associated protein 1
LKERFYNIQQTLYHKAGGASTPFTFDKAKELERKHALGSLYSRKKEQQQEETELLAHVKRIEQNKAKLAKERENLQEMVRQHEVAMIPINKKQTAKDKKVRSITSLPNDGILILFFSLSPSL